MRPEVSELNQFYASRLGQVARRLIRRRLRAQWPSVAGLNVLGLGYAIPYLRPFLDEAQRVVAMMPAAQGVRPWPGTGPNLVALAEEAELPLPDATFDRVLLVHALENAEELRPMLRECWRVLASGGRMMVVVPNRRGLWARAETTPFAHGSPYSMTQVTRLLRDTLFAPIAWQRALYVPPWDWGFALRAAGAIEDLGDRLFGTFAGVLMVEATKQIYAATPARSGARARARPAAIPATES
ncbi:MAG: class I SAM-dependent methyltransferase [Alphaproteobacteria bacterium]|nr:class I SAM-dependent methyltransferase [Alphaproteobacteria bacterium]